MADSERDEIYQAAEQRASRITLRPRDIPAFLQGYFKNIALTATAGIVERHERDDCYIFPGLGLLWQEPGTPYVPGEALAAYDIGRLTSIMRRVFDACARTDSFTALSTKRGRDRDDLLRRVGLGAYL